MNTTRESTSRDAAESLQQVPRATIHKKILNAAADDPDSSMEEIAEQVSGASVGLVEKVLDQYGDPAEQQESTDQPETNDADENSVNEDGVDQPDADPTDVDRNDGYQSDSDQSNPMETKTDHDRTRNFNSEPPVDLSELTEKQRETLRIIAEVPEITQTELADRFGVSAATINTRVNSIDGFEWSNRHQFLERLFDDLVQSPDSGTPNHRHWRELSDKLDTLSDRVTEMENCLRSLKSERDAEERSEVVFDDPELLRKLIHACIHSEQVSEEEELQIIKEFLE